MKLMENIGMRKRRNATCNDVEMKTCKKFVMMAFSMRSNIWCPAHRFKCVYMHYSVIDVISRVVIFSL